MKLRTYLQMGAIIPILFALFMTLGLWTLYPPTESTYRMTFFLALTGILGLSTAAGVLIYSAATLHRLRGIEEWTRQILEGKLDRKLDVPTKTDELSELSIAVQKIVEELRDAYLQASREANSFKKQNEENQRLATASQAGLKHLTEALNKARQAQYEAVHQEHLNGLRQAIRGMSHDLGEALMPIAITTELWMSQPARLDNREEVLRQAKDLSAAVERARKILKNVSAFYHVETEAPDRVDLTEIAHRTLAEFESSRKEDLCRPGRSIEIRKVLLPLPPVAANAVDIQEALENLLTNAVEAMPEGGHVIVSSQLQPDGVLLEVQDSGRGMSEEARKRCFEPFFSTKGSHHRGSGLTSVNGIVRRYGGTVEVDSQPDRGTRVRLRFPLWQNRFEKTAQKPATDLPTLQPLRILLVEDDFLSRKLVSEILTADGHTLQVAALGRDALNLLARNELDAAIVDRALPDCLGDEVCAKIKQKSPAILTIMLTGYGDIMREEGDIPESIDVLLAKPARVQELQEALLLAKRKPSAS